MYNWAYILTDITDVREITERYLWIHAVRAARCSREMQVNKVEGLTSLRAGPYQRVSQWRDPRSNIHVRDAGCVASVHIIYINCQS